MSTDPVARLAVYGTLAPGEPNHHHLAQLSGRWIEGVVRGDLRNAGWGAAMGYPGLTLREDGPEVRVQVFESPDLADHWSRLDDFEGDGYRRVETTVRTPAGDVPAHIYVLAPASDPPSA